MFKKWKVTYTNAATGDQRHALVLDGPQRTVEAVKAHVEEHVKHTVGGEVFPSTLISAEEVGATPASPNVVAPAAE